VEKLLLLHSQQQNGRLPHSAYQGRTLDEIFGGTAVDAKADDDELETLRSNPDCESSSLVFGIFPHRVTYGQASVKAQSGYLMIVKA
jgi:hypothetical protein